MSLYIALLRGVNVGGHGKVAMADLKAMLADMGFDEPRSLLQSGNLVFGAPRAKPEALETRLHKEISARFDLKTELFVRSPQEWADLIAGNPFAAEARTDPGRLLAWVMKQAPTAKAVEGLRNANPGPETMQAKGRTLYIYFPEGQGNSKLTSLIDRHIPGRGTVRNWNKVLKLQAMVAK